jgi:hypothetical protein
MLLVVMRPEASTDDVARVADLVRERGLTPQVMPGTAQTAIAVMGVEGRAVSAPPSGRAARPASPRRRRQAP